MTCAARGVDVRQSPVETAKIVGGEDVGNVIGVDERGEEIGVVVLGVFIPLVGGVTRTTAAVDATAIAIAVGTCDVGGISGCAAAEAAAEEEQKQRRDGRGQRGVTVAVAGCSP